MCRIFDIVTYRLYFVFLKSYWKPWKDARRSLIIAFANLYEVVIAYGLLFLRTGEICNYRTKLSGFWNTIYYSVVTITTLGYGDYVPTDTLSRILVICELLTGIAFLIMIIPPLMALFSESHGCLRRGYLPDTEQAVRGVSLKYTRTVSHARAILTTFGQGRSRKVFLEELRPLTIHAQKS